MYESNLFHVRLYRIKNNSHGVLSLFALLLFYAIAMVFQLYHSGDMMYEMRRKSESTLLLTQGIFNLPHHIGMP